MAKFPILYKPFENWSDFNVIWVYSDPHFNDSDCKLMDENWPSAEEQIKKINSKVGKKDVLILLGDIGDIECVKKLNGYKVLLTGNHDKGVTNYLNKSVITLKHGLVIKENKGLFDEVYDGALFISPKILLSHEPIEIPFGLNIHGHCHSGERFVHEGTGARVNVCGNVVNYEPQRLDKIAKTFRVYDIHRVTIDNLKPIKK